MIARRKVLVVDDEPVVIWSCNRILSREGIDVECALSGRDGLLLAESSRFDAVLLDLRMPDMDGMEVLNNLKKMEPGIRVIIITGFASVDSAVEAFKLGAFDYVSKPFTPKELAETVRRALEPGQSMKPAPEPFVAPEIKVKSKMFPTGQGRSIQMVNRKLEKIAVIGLGGIFLPDSVCFSAIRESFKKANLPITIEYGNHEVKGKEILPYLEDHDKVIVVTNAAMGRKPGTIRKFRASDYRTKRWAPIIEVPQIGFPYIGAWAKSIGTATDLVVIAVETDSEEDTFGMDESVQRRLLTEIWLEVY